MTETIYQTAARTVVSGDLEDHVHEQLEAVLARVLASDVGGRQIKEISAGFGTQRVDEHLLASTARSCEQD